jgi:nucleoid DNA-binding protein
MINKSSLTHSLTRKINKTTGVSLRDASICIDIIFDAITAAISRGERVELRGFGSFFVKETAARKAVFADVPAHGKVIFRPSKRLRLSAWDKVKD